MLRLIGSMNRNWQGGRSSISQGFVDCSNFLSSGRCGDKLTLLNGVGLGGNF